MERINHYPIEITIWITQKDMDKLMSIADARGYKIYNRLGEPLKQPKPNLSTIVREILEKELDKM